MSLLETLQGWDDTTLPPLPFSYQKRQILDSYLLHEFPATQVLVSGNSKSDDAQRKAQLRVFYNIVYAQNK